MYKRKEHQPTYKEVVRYDDGIDQDQGVQVGTVQGEGVEGLRMYELWLCQG